MFASPTKLLDKSRIKMKQVLIKFMLTQKYSPIYLIRLHAIISANKSIKTMKQVLMKFMVTNKYSTV